MDLFFLESKSPLTKKFVAKPDGTIEKTSYLNAYEVTSYKETITNLVDFHAALTKHAAIGHCMLKGELSRPLVKESRKNSTNATADTWWVCLDIDGLPPQYSVDDLLGLVGITNTSYILQWSASQNITSTDLRCHVFLMLARPASAPLLKQWLVQLNHGTAFLRDNMGLTKTGMALTWGLDITACQNDKLIYIAPPILENIKAPLGRRPRYELVRKANHVFELPARINSVDENRKLTIDRVSTLRTFHKLPERKFTQRLYKDVEVLSKPDEATITGIRHERGFTYFNFNGGDSWAYYHPDDDIEVIRNFKGEPNYATKELLPEYYSQAKKDHTSLSHGESSVGAYVVDQKQPILLAFRDAASGTYKHGTYEPTTDTLLLNDARSEKQIRDFCMQYGMPMGDFIPIWDMVFEPQNPTRIDVEERKINMFQRSEYMLKTTKPRSTNCPRTVLKIVSHMLAHDAVAIAHLFNWCAYIVQRRERPATGWVFYGTEGTGKGMFVNKIMRPLLGINQTAMRRGDELSAQYNTYMKNTLLVAFDEAHIAEMKDAESVMAKLRNFITEPTIQIRAMYSNAVEHKNFAGILCLSNKPNVILLQKHDRRWNIGPFQHEKLELTQKEVDETITSELQGFYDFLAHWPLDEAAARTPLVSEDRDRLIGTTTSSADEVAAALNARGGNLEFFLDQLPTNTPREVNSLVGTVSDYRNVLKNLLLRGIADGAGRVKISRDELHVLFEYTVGNMPKTPNKFTKFLAHRHIHTEKVRIDKPVYGVQVIFKDHVRFPEYMKDYFPTEQVTDTKPKAKK